MEDSRRRAKRVKLTENAGMPMQNMTSTATKRTVLSHGETTSSMFKKTIWNYFLSFLKLFCQM